VASVVCTMCELLTRLNLRQMQKREKIRLKKFEESEADRQR
jgi:hypothetical protein